MKRLPLLLWILASCDSATNNVTTEPDLSLVTTGGDLAVKPGADLSTKPGIDMTVLRDLAPPSGDLAHVAGTVPNPGSGDPLALFPWPDNEPNSTPDTAMPVGVATGTTIRPWFDTGTNTIGGTDTADYWVFQSSPSGGTFSFTIGWSGGTNLADAALYKVVGGVEQMPAVQTWMDTSTTGENSSTPPAMDATLEPSTVYLFAVFAVDAPTPTGLNA